MAVCVRKKWNCHFRHLFLSMSVLALMSCGGSDGPVAPLAGANDSPKIPQTNQDTPVVGALVPQQSTLLRELAPQASDAEVTTAAGSVSRFGLTLFSDWMSQAENAQSNFIFSPLSLYAALLMAQVGAENETLKQMSGVLQLTVPRQQANVGFNALDLALQGRGQIAGDGKLGMVNGLFLEKTQFTLPRFLDTLAVNFGAGVFPIDTSTAAAAENSRLVVNEWFKQQTAGKFPEFLPPESLAAAGLVISNAVTFQGAWKSAFVGALTNDRDFFLTTGVQKTASFMGQDANILVKHAPSYDAVELPIAGDDFALQLVLPQIGQFQTVASALNTNPEFNFLEGGVVTFARIVMPKFKFETMLPAKAALARLGMANAFDPHSADFSGVDGQKSLVISTVLHKAAISVDEKGLEASAASAVILTPPSLPEEITIDRPFFFAIRDLKTGLVAFVGRVMDPTL